MRSILRLNTLIAVFLFIFSPHLTSCHENDENKDDSTTNRTEIIQITDGDINKNTLTLKDVNEEQADSFKIRHGRNIKWLLVKNRTVAEIKNIVKKTTPPSDDIFSILPHPIANSFNWEGTILGASSIGKTEAYSIDWIDTSGVKHTYDPKIQVY